VKIELDLPQQLVDDLSDRSRQRGLSVNDYAAELLAREALGEEGRLENRPDWQAALERSRADLAAGRTVPHEEVQRWHQSQPESSGRKHR
jgi:predicted transcriptional regulator